MIRAEVIRYGLFIFMLLAPLFQVFSPVPASAASPVSSVAAGTCANPGASITIFPRWDKFLDCDPTTGAIKDFDFPLDLWLVVIALVEILIRLGLYLAVGFVIFGGIKMLISQGSPEKIQEAKSIIEQAIVGMIISMLAISIVVFIERSVL